jgi:hypothetical protein
MLIYREMSKKHCIKSRFTEDFSQSLINPFELDSLLYSD